MRVELDFEFAGEELFGKGGVFANIGGDHFADLAGLQQDAQAAIIDAGVVADANEVLGAGCADGLDQDLGDAAEAEAAGHDGHAVMQQAGEGLRRICVNLVHRHENLRVRMRRDVPSDPGRGKETSIWTRYEGRSGVGSAGAEGCLQVLHRWAMCYEYARRDRCRVYGGING